MLALASVVSTVTESLPLVHGWPAHRLGVVGVCETFRNLDLSNLILVNHTEAIGEHVDCCFPEL